MGGAGGELRSSKAIKSNGSALKNAMSAEKKNSPAKGSSDSNSLQQTRQRDKLLINNGGTVMASGSHSLPINVGGAASVGGPGSAS
jgi:hypothetical protein